MPALSIPMHVHGAEDQGWAFFAPMPSVLLVCVLALGLCLHSWHIVSGGGLTRVRQPSVFHAVHALMAFSMIDMVILMSFGTSALPSWAWVLASALVAIALALSMTAQSKSGKGFSFLWPLAVFELLSTTYMWLPLDAWLGPVTAALVILHLIVGLLWLGGLMRDDNDLARVGGSQPHVVLCLKSRAEQLAMGAASLAGAFMLAGMAAVQ